MDLSESTRTVFDRIQKIEPELVSKIIGYVLLKDCGEREMIRLAFGPDPLIHSLINEAKAALPSLGLSPKPTVSPAPQSIPDLPLQFSAYTPIGSRPFSSPANFRVPTPYWDPQLPSDQQLANYNIEFSPSPYTDSIGDDFRVHNQPQFVSFEDQLDTVSHIGSNFPGTCYYQEAALAGGLSSRTSRRSPSLPEFPAKICHYYNKGYCKHGSNCRYLHGQSIPDSFSQLYCANSNELVNDDHFFSPDSLEKLEVELTELLKSRDGQPISIAMLPMMYFERYGKVLQADGYLTESQRHGKAGYSLTKLLARLKNSIRIIDRPHGQHSVMLAEDASRYMEYKNERSDPGAIVAGSHQIYLTFPAESTFTEDDVSSYFNQYGPVRDVRIPCQQKRMFGFVSFVHPETVKTILSKGNPHYVCGARVLVKPYREKSRVESKYIEKTESPSYYPSQYTAIDSELYSMPRVCDTSRLLRKQLIGEHEHLLELQRRRFSELQLAAPKPLTQQPYFGYSMDDLKVSEAHADHDELPSADHFSYQLDVLTNGSTSDDMARHTSNNYSAQDSGQIDLPDSPFASSAVGSGISTVI